MILGGVLGILDSLKSGEVLMILVLAMVVLGPERLPETARQIGRWIAKARSATSGFTSEFKDVIDDPQMQPLREVGEFVASPRRKLMEYAAEAESEAAEARRLAQQAADAAAAAEAAAKAARANADEVDEILDDATGDAADTEGEAVTADSTDVSAADTPPEHIDSTVAGDDAEPTLPEDPAAES